MNINEYADKIFDTHKHFLINAYTDQIVDRREDLLKFAISHIESCLNDENLNRFDYDTHPNHIYHDIKISVAINALLTYCSFVKCDIAAITKEKELYINEVIIPLDKLINIDFKITGKESKGPFPVTDLMKNYFDKLEMVKKQ